MISNYSTVMVLNHYQQHNLFFCKEKYLVHITKESEMYLPLA